MGKPSPRCRKTPPHSPPVTSPIVYSHAALAASSVNRTQAKPSSTMSRPTRLSGRARHAYRPVPTKLQITAGANTAHTTRASRWSLASSIATTAAPADQRGDGDRRGARHAQQVLSVGFHDPAWFQAGVIYEIASRSLAARRIAASIAGTSCISSRSAAALSLARRRSLAATTVASRG